MLGMLCTFLNMDFVEELNPLYAFPIVAVIVCAFIVYAFGFKSPVQPPSFEGIEDEKKTSKKRKTKDASKGKIVQNGKLNGNTSYKAVSTKKKDVEKSTSVDKSMAEKSTTEKKVAKKTKLSNEKKVVHEKKKESFSQEDSGEDGWVQLISKKGRKSRKKEEIVTTENQIMNKTLKITDDIITSEELLLKDNVLKKQITETKLIMKNDAEEVEAVCIESNQDKVIIIEDDSMVQNNSLEKVPLKENVLKSRKFDEEASNKSKKKKKKNAEVLNADNDYVISSSELPAVQVILDTSPSKDAINTFDVAELPEIIADTAEEIQPKESKSSNVVFDELAGLYPKEEKELRKKKKVRRDH